MSQSSTLYIGMDVHNDSSAVADVAQDLGTEVTDLGPSGTRPCDIDPLTRTLQSKATPLVFGYEAGPCGDSLSKQRHAGCFPLDTDMRYEYIPLLNRFMDIINTDGGVLFCCEQEARR